MKKFYKKEDLANYNYVIVQWDEEDGCYTLISMHKEKEMAQKRLDYLNAKAEELFNKGLWTGRYGLWETTDERIKWDEEDEIFYLLRK